MTFSALKHFFSIFAPFILASFLFSFVSFGCSGSELISLSVSGNGNCPESRECELSDLIGAWKNVDAKGDTYYLMIYPNLDIYVWSARDVSKLGATYVDFNDVVTYTSDRFIDTKANVRFSVASHNVIEDSSGNLYKKVKNN